MMADLTCDGCRFLSPRVDKPGCVCDSLGLNVPGSLERLEECKAQNSKETVCSNCFGWIKIVNGREVGHSPAC